MMSFPRELSSSASAPAPMVARSWTAAPLATRPVTPGARRSS